MKKVLPILNIITRVLVIISLTLTTLLSLSMAYIMYAPDEFPKPFRLVYQYPVEPVAYLPPGVIPDNCAQAEEEIAAVVDEVQPGDGLMVNMETKIINLSDPTGHKYIRLTVVLEFTPEPVVEETRTGGEGEAATAEDVQSAAINARMPLMEDIVINILSTKTFDDLYTATGKEHLRQEILSAIDQRLPELNILSVYFTEFVVQ